MWADCLEIEITSKPVLDLRAWDYLYVYLLRVLCDRRMTDWLNAGSAKTWRTSLSCTTRHLSGMKVCTARSPPVSVRLCVWAVLSICLALFWVHHLGRRYHWYYEYC